MLQYVAVNQSARSAYNAISLHSKCIKVVNTLSFDNWRFRSSRLIKRAQTTPRYQLYTRGSVTAVLARCTHYNTPNNEVDELTPDIAASITLQFDKVASNGMRTLAFAVRSLVDDSVETYKAEQLETCMTFEGVFAFTDSVKFDAASAVQQLHRAGIDVKIVSGDSAASVQSVAQTCGILAASSAIDRSNTIPINMFKNVYGKPPSDDAGHRLTTEHQTYARVPPDDKYELVLCHQRAGETVMVTGDGVNDGLSLKAADVGVAMGEHGTDMARQSAGVILIDDSLSSIGIAVQEGRRMLTNLWASIRFYLACKFAIAVLFGSTLIYNGTLPLQPLQVILLESFMDLGAGACFVLEPSMPDAMTTPPQQYANGGLGTSSKPLVRYLAQPVVIYGTGLWLLVSVSYIIGLHVDVQTAQSMVWLTWLVGHVLLANVMRNRSVLSPSTQMSNIAMLAWTCSAIVFGVVSICAPLLRNMFLLSNLSQSVTISNMTVPLWMWAVAPTIAVFFIVQSIKLCTAR